MSALGQKQTRKTRAMRTMCAKGYINPFLKVLRNFAHVR
jgi:hypothetical protein